jgi:hypothetical protein
VIKLPMFLVVKSGEARSSTKAGYYQAWPFADSLSGVVQLITACFRLSCPSSLRRKDHNGIRPRSASRQLDKGIVYAIWYHGEVVPKRHAPKFFLASQGGRF